MSRQRIAPQARATKDRETIALLWNIANRDTTIGKSDLDFFLARFKRLNKYHGSISAPGSVAEPDSAAVMYDDTRGYDWMGGFQCTPSKLTKDLSAFNLPGITGLSVPVYFMTRCYVWNVTGENITDFVDKLRAAHKEIMSCE